VEYQTSIGHESDIVRNESVVMSSRIDTAVLNTNNAKHRIDIVAVELIHRKALISTVENRSLEPTRRSDRHVSATIRFARVEVAGWRRRCFEARKRESDELDPQAGPAQKVRDLFS